MHTTANTTESYILINVQHVYMDELVILKNYTFILHGYFGHIQGSLDKNLFCALSLGPINSDRLKNVGWAVNQWLFPNLYFFCFTCESLIQKS